MCIRDRCLGRHQRSPQNDDRDRKVQRRKPRRLVGTRTRKLGYYLNAGPSEDFVIGMLYEQVSGVVERQILQEEDGRYISKMKLYQENARASYDENGCKDLK